MEQRIREYLGWKKGRVVYYQNENIKYDLDVDNCYPNNQNPEAFVSVTYCDPDTPGHSNENKLQLKLGELLLLKSKYPQIRAVLVVGIVKEAWLKYVLQAFEYFYDEVLFTWDSEFKEKLREIKGNPSLISLKHQTTWEQLAKEWSHCLLTQKPPIDSSLRINTYNYILKHGCEGNLPSDIANEIIRKCMQAAYDRSVETRARSGREWENYRKEKWEKLWQSRSFFNPAEAVIELLLDWGGYAHLGKVSEDFILFSNKLNMPVFIQSKSSGGGKERHGKNIQNRTKEQLARCLFYRGIIKGDEIILRDKNFYWISVLDGNWGVTEKTPLKYIHMLQWAGYDFIIGADDLVDDNLSVIYGDSNVLLEKLADLDCEKNEDQFLQKWKAWYQDKK